MYYNFGWCQFLHAYLSQMTLEIMLLHVHTAVFTQDELYISFTDYSTGFGGTYGVQTDRVDKVIKHFFICRRGQFGLLTCTMVSTIFRFN